jgi:hypothetical protein
MIFSRYQYITILLILFVSTLRSQEHQEHGWYVVFSKDPTSDAINRPNEVISDLLYLPKNAAEIINNRRVLLTSVANNNEVLPLIRIEIADLLLTTWNIDPEHQMTLNERLKLEGIKYGIFQTFNYAKSMKLLSQVIIIYDLPKVAEDCFRILREDRWDVDIDDIQYVLTNIIPKVEIIK